MTLVSMFTLLAVGAISFEMTWEAVALGLLAVYFVGG